MLLRSFCTLLATVALVLPLRAAEPTLAENAALKYWKASDCLPKYTPEENKVLVEGTDKSARMAILKKHFESRSFCLDHLHRGAKLARCDWSLDYEEGVLMLLPHIQLCRELARAASLRAEYEFETGNPAAAIDDLLAIWIMARHIGQENILLPVLVQYAIEAIGVEKTACRYLPTLTPELRKRLTDGLARRPEGGSPPRTMRKEKAVFLPWLRKEATGNWQKSDDVEMKKIMKSLDAKADVGKLLDEMGTYYDRMAELATQPYPYDDATKGYDDLMKSTPANPFSKLVLPSFHKLMVAEARTKVRWAMFDAALKIVADGPDAVKQTRDPHGDRPFGYRKTDAGFELESKLKYGNNLVTLLVGPKTK